MALVPVFVFSLPRSGSTLTQRILSAHQGVASAAEPWLLLPLLGPLAPSIASRMPWDNTVAGAINDFTHALPQGADRYRSEVRGMVHNLYDAIAGSDNAFFIDKTPPYHWIVDEIVATFP